MPRRTMRVEPKDREKAQRLPARSWVVSVCAHGVTLPDPQPQGAPNPGGGVAAALKQPSADGYVHESLQSTLPRFRKTVHVGDRIRDKHSGRTGTCLYVGPADFARGKEARAYPALPHRI